MQKSIPTLWEQAYDELSDSDKDDLQIDRNLAATNPYSVLKTITDKRDECLRKQWVLYTDKKGDKVLVRDMFNKVSSWIDHFKHVGDAAIQFDPGHAAIPWAAVKMLLQVSS